MACSPDSSVQVNNEADKRILVAEITQRIEAWVDANEDLVAEGAWIEGSGWDQTLWNVKEFPSAVRAVRKSTLSQARTHLSRSHIISGRLGHAKTSKPPYCALPGRLSCLLGLASHTQSAPFTTTYRDPWWENHSFPRQWPPYRCVHR